MPPTTTWPLAQFMDRSTNTSSRAVPLRRGQDVHLILVSPPCLGHTETVSPFVVHSQVECEQEVFKTGGAFFISGGASFTQRECAWGPCCLCASQCCPVLLLQCGLHGQSSRSIGLVRFHYSVDLLGYFCIAVNVCQQLLTVASFLHEQVVPPFFLVLLPELQCSRRCAWHFLARDFFFFLIVRPSSLSP